MTKRLFELGVMVMLLVAVTGCMATRTTTYFKNGEVDKVVVDRRPFLFDKGVDLGAKLVGLDLKCVDPNTGNPAPSVNINYGDTRARTIPMTTGLDTVVEIFGTFSETFTWSKSMWGAEVGSIDYTLNAGGIGVFAIGDSSKAEDRIGRIIARINELKVATDNAAGSSDIPSVPAVK